MFCFAPVIFAGYLLTITTSWHHTPSVDSPGLEVQTCEAGLGLHVKAYTEGVYGLGTQYGFHKQWEHWSVNFQPQAGLAHADGGGTSEKYFELGAQFTVGYDRARIGVEYWHMSNAGLSDPNIGLDMLVLQTGWKF